MAGQDLTTLLEAPARSDPRTADRLLALVYDEMCNLAAAMLDREDRQHTLDPHALVHEAYLKLVDQSRVDWQGRTHFFAVGAEAMRRILIDHGRGRKRAKRGGNWNRVTLEGAGSITGQPGTRALALSEALEKLEREDPQQARIVRLRYFSGLSVKETAQTLGLSVRTVEREWTHARAWLRRELSKGDTSAADHEAGCGKSD